MSGLTRAGDLFYTYRFIKILTTPWKESKAYEYGIIDDNGKVLRKSRELRTSDEKSSYTLFHRLIFSLKRLLEKLPFGSNPLSSYAAALFMLKEHTGMSDEHLIKVFNEVYGDELFKESMVLTESQEHWFARSDNQELSLGTYTLKRPILLENTGEAVFTVGSNVRVDKDTRSPIGSVLGVPIYRVQHVQTGRFLCLSGDDIIKG